MDIRKLQRAIVDGLEEVKGQNIVVFNTEHLSPLFERVIIASGTSNRQTRALAASVRDAVKSRGLGPTRTEGEDNGEWIIVDCGAAVVHLMQPAIRDYYRLEEIWGDKPVRMKLDGAPRHRAKAAAPAAVPSDAPAAPRAAKPAPAKKRSASAGEPSAAGVAQRGRTAAASPASPAGAAPAKRAAPRKPVVRVVGVKRSAAAQGMSAPPARRKAEPATSARPAAAKKAAVPRTAAKSSRRKA